MRDPAQYDPTRAVLRGEDFGEYAPDVLEQLRYDGWSPEVVTQLTLTEVKIVDGGFISALNKLVLLDLRGSTVDTVFPLPNVTKLDLRGTVSADGSRWEIPASVRELRLSSVAQLSSLDSLPRLRVLQVTKDEFYPDLYYLLVKKETALEQLYIPSPDVDHIRRILLQGGDVRFAPSYTAMATGTSASAEGGVGLYNSVIRVWEHDERIV